MSETNPDELPPADRRSPRVEKLHDLPATPERQAMRRLAAAGRDMIDAMTSTSATEAQLVAASEQLEGVVAVLRGFPADDDYVGISELANAGPTLAERLVEAGSSEAWDQFDHSPFIGLANPMSPPMHFTYQADSLLGEVTFGAAYEGPPGCVHGGYVAAAFDELLGATQSLSGAMGMTASLEVNYRKPTPLHTPLRLLGTFSERDGRKIWVDGRMYAGDVITAEARGLFVAFDSERFQALMDARADARRGDG